MLKSKFLRRGLVMFLFGTFGLFSCSQNASVSSTGNPSDLTGSVEVTLPDMSSSGLAKSALLLDANALNLFITGDDMDTIKYSWPMNSLKGQRVRINGIPAGKYRYFSGFLTDKSGIVTHMGKVAATITPGVVVPVVLKLSATGGVDLCIEIEGYPTSCSSVDSILINGCVKVHSYNAFDGKISLTARQSYVNGYVEFTDSIFKRFTIVKMIGMKDSAGLTYCEFAGYCKETGINSQYVLMVRGSSVVSGYIYNNANKELIYKFYSVECTQPDTLVLSGLLNAYYSTPDQHDSGSVKFQMRIANGRADGYMSLYNSYDKSILNLSLRGTGNFYPEKRYGDINVAGSDDNKNTYTLTMSFNNTGKTLYCKGSLVKNGSESIATIYGDI